MIAQTKIPAAELEVFKALKGIEVVFDVGARTDVDYFEIKPDATYHLFEPNPEFFEELKRLVGDRKGVYLNNYGLGDIEGTFHYSNGVQAFERGEANSVGGELELPVKTLDSYANDHQIKRIDFLKIDVEGYDYKVLIGGINTIPKCRYIQYEYWNDQQEFHRLLEKDFDLEYIGYRNVLCISKTLVSEEDRKELVEFIHKNKFAELS